MKKLFLAVALVAASLSASAVGFDFSAGGLFTNFSTLVTLNSTLTKDAATAAPYTITTSGASVEGILTIVGSGVTMSHTNATSTTSFKVYDTYIVPNGAGRVMTISCNAGDVITLGTKSYSSGAARLTIAGATPVTDTLLINTAETKTFTATGTTVTITNTIGKYEVQKVAINGATTVTGTGIKDAISSKLLSKVGSELVNPTNLDVEIYSVLGNKILTSKKSTISVSSLPSGVYVAKTAEGTLKFVK